MEDNNLLETTKSYYDSTDADEFYHTIWGGEDIHVGMYQYPGEDIFQASKRTVVHMASMASPIGKDTRILDLGSGYGGAARYLASTFGCHVDCLNLSEVENQRNIDKNKAVMLTQLITVTTGNFEEIPFGDEKYDIVWSEDSFLHSGNKSQIFKEIKRVLKKGGKLIFTDPMQADDCPSDVLQPILDRIHLEEMGSVKLYKQLANDNGFKPIEIQEMPQHLTNHYSSVLKQLESKEEILSKVCSGPYIQRMKNGLKHWIEGGKNGYLNWGILMFRLEK